VFEKLKEKTYLANMMLKEHGLVVLTWGNVSEIDESREYVAIKPSGVEYGSLNPESIVVVNMKGEVVEGNLKPSSDTATHLELYKAYKEIGGVCHTHSMYATSFAQAYWPPRLVAMGTTHADYFDGAIPRTRAMKKKEIEGDYEKNTGSVIIETLKNSGKSPANMPAVLVNSHGPFTFGKNANQAVEHSIILENVAQMAFNAKIITNVTYVKYEMPKSLLRKHFDRKHGAKAYYGQDENPIDKN
jgi:L-ribulose-5-phosphate 4-epimerase